MLLSLIHQLRDTLHRDGSLYLREDGTLKIRVQTAPEKGKANKAVATVLAKTFSVSESSIILISGHTDPLKFFKITLS
jgi:uncharacterized protein YggU (UPF0235/DUF167 family)